MALVLFTLLVFTGILSVVLLSGFTGYLLPWDQTAYWAITISTEMIGLVPGLGPALQQFVIGGDHIGSPTLINFYALHIVVTLVLIHFDASFAILLIPLIVAFGLVAVAFIPYEANIAGDWFLTGKGRRMREAIVNR